LGCQVFTTISAGDALAALDGFQPDLILIDMNIEDMKSSEFLKKIKETSFKKTPIISYTKLLTYKLTDPAFLQKPFGAGSEDFDQMLDVMKDNIALVPGEIILWVVEALMKQNHQVPPLLALAATVLKNVKK
jgi:two-component SAPR family response regulator